MKLITFEGVDGVGKSRVIEQIYHELLDKGYRVKMFREPGSTKVGAEIRKILKCNITNSKNTNFLLFLAARSELTKEFDKHKDYDFVLLDRYVDSTIAYQCYGNGVPIYLINEIHGFILNNYVPNLTFYLTVDEKTRLERLQNRVDDIDPFDLDQDYARRVKMGYEILKSQNPARIIEIENYDFETTIDQIMFKLENL